MESMENLFIFHCRLRSTRYIADYSAAWSRPRMALFGDQECWDLRDQVTNSFQKVFDLPAVQVSVGHEHMVALDDQNRLWGWGRNEHGQLSPLIDDTLVPKVLRDDVQDVITGCSSTFVRTTRNEVFVCGDNGLGQLAMRPLSPGLGWRVNPNLTIDMISRFPKSRRIKSAQSARDSSAP